MPKVGMDVGGGVVAREVPLSTLKAYLSAEIYACLKGLPRFTDWAQLPLDSKGIRYVAGLGVTKTSADAVLGKRVTILLNSLVPERLGPKILRFEQAPNAEFSTTMWVTVMYMELSPEEADTFDLIAQKEEVKV